MRPPFSPGQPHVPPAATWFSTSRHDIPFHYAPVDHTSIIRFIEQRFGPRNPLLVEPNITPWRRAVAGNLTSAFDFGSPNKALATLLGTAAFAPPDALRRPDYKPMPPSTQSLPAQEPGLRRALPYRPVVEGGTQAGQFAISFGNGGSVGTVYQMRSGNPLDLPAPIRWRPA